MDLVKWYKEKSLKYFGDIIKPYLYVVEDLKPDLLKSDLSLSLREYASMGVMTSVLIFLIEFPLIAFITGILPTFDLLLAVFFSFTVSIGFSMIIAFFFYIYPSINASNRAESIDYSLPFATTYLATISGSGSPPTTLFRVLSEFREYEEIADEANKIVRNVELFGMTIIESLAKAARQSPSKNFKEVLWGIITSIRTGSDLTAYLHSKSRELMRGYERKLNEYSNNLSTFLQIYLTLIVVGSIFFIIITAIMSAFGLGEAMGNMIVMSQFATVFILLPAISFGFIWLLKATYPGE